MIIISSNQVILAQGGDKDTVWMRRTTQNYKIRFSPDDTKIVDVCSGGLRIFETQTGKEIKKIDSVGYAEIDSVRNRLIVSWLNKFEIYDLNNLEKVSDFYDPGTPVYFPSFSSKNNRVVGQKEGGFTFKVWDCNTGKEIFSKSYDTLINPASGRKSPGYLNHQYYNDGKNVLGVEIDYIDYHDGDPKKMPYVFKRVFEVYDATTMQIISDNSLFCNQYLSQSGNYGAYFGGDAKNPILIVKSINNSDEILKIPLITLYDATDVQFSSDDNFIGISYNGKYILEIWSLIKKQLVYTYQWHPEGSFSTLAFNKNNSLITASSGYRLYLYRAPLSSVEPQNIIKSTIILPNPSNKDIISLEFNLESPNPTLINIFDILGNNVLLVENKYLDTGHYNYSINLNSLANGQYNLKIESGKCFQILPFILAK